MDKVVLFYMFLGEYTHSIDQKKRLAIPVKFRTEAGNTVVITPRVRFVSFCVSCERVGKVGKNFAIASLGTG